MAKDLSSEKSPWWRSGVTVALLGSAIPVASFIQGWWQKEKELELQRQRQFSDLRVSYANLMLEGGVERVGLLADFIAQTESDKEIKAWAANQSRVAKAQSAELQKELALQQQKVVETEQRLVAALAKAEELRKQAEAAKGEARAEVVAKEAAARQALIQAETSAAVAQSNLAGSYETLKGRQVQQVAPPVQQMIKNPAVQRRLDVFDAKR